jgi:hypothetical protein
MKHFSYLTTSATRLIPVAKYTPTTRNATTNSTASSLVIRLLSVSRLATGLAGYGQYSAVVSSLYWLAHHWTTCLVTGLASPALDWVVLSLYYSAIASISALALATSSEMGDTTTVSSPTKSTIWH